MLKVTHKNSAQRRYFEAKAKDTDIIQIHDKDGNVIDERICNISILPREDVGNRPIDREIDGLLNYLKTGKVPSHSNVVLMSPSERLATLKAQYGDDWKKFWDSDTNSVMSSSDDVYDPFFAPLKNHKGKVIIPYENDDDDPEVQQMKKSLAKGDIRKDTFDDFMARRKAELADAIERQPLEQAAQDELRKLNRISCVARLKKLLTACQMNGLMTDEYIQSLMSELVESGETRVPLSVSQTHDPVIISAALLKRDYPDVFEGVRFSIYSTIPDSDIDEVLKEMGYGDIDKKDMGHGMGSHEHTPALNPKDADGNNVPNGLKDPEGQRRLVGVNPDPDSKDKSSIGARLDWEKSSYRFIAEDEATKYIDRLVKMFPNAGGNALVSGRDKVSDADLPSELVRSIQTDYKAGGTKRSGFGVFDKWNGDPSQQDVGFDTAHYLSAGITVSMGSFERQAGKFQYNLGGKKVTPTWKLPMTLTIYIPSKGSLDTEDREYDFNPFAVGIFFDMSYASGVDNMRRHVDEATVNFKERIKKNGLGYGVVLLENKREPLAYCNARNPERQKEALRFIVRCACGCLGEVIDMVDGVDQNDEKSIARIVNMYYTERKNGMIRQRKTLRRFESAGDMIEDVDQLIDALEEFCGNRYRERELRNRAGVYVHDQNHGGQGFYVRLDDDYLVGIYFNLRSVVDSCVERVADALSDYDGDDFTSACIEELSIALSEEWTEKFEEYGSKSIPMTKDDLFKFLRMVSDDVDAYIVQLASAHVDDVEDIIVNHYGDEDEEDDEYEENMGRRNIGRRTRFETRYGR